MLKKIKHSLVCIMRKNNLTDTVFFKILQSVNNLLYHGNERMVLKKYGEKNEGITFYVIRRFSTEEGLLSMYFGILREIEWAFSKGYVPFVDLQNNRTQYTTGELINGTRNAWEYFWEQPSTYKIDEIYKSKSVILSGKNKETDKERYLRSKIINYDFMDSDNTHELYMFIKKNIDVKSYIYERVERLWEKKFRGRVIGVFVRGTDYVVFQPKGHPIQPTKEQIYEQLMILKKKYSDTKVFLVTEDDTIYTFFKEKLKDELIEIEDIRFSQYKGDDYLFKYCVNNTYQIGLQYLTKLLLLSRCNYLVTSIASGSMFANIMNDNHYEEKVVINMGRYK